MMTNSSSFYFGKIPSRSDFIKSASSTKVIGLMDQWIAHGMEMLMAMPDWKASFDSGGPFDFLFLGMKRRHAIHGTMAPSRDSSSRRFPLIAATSFELADPVQFLRLGSLALQGIYESRRHIMHHAIQSLDMPYSIELLNNRMANSDFYIQGAEARCTSYLAAQSVASMSAMLTADLNSVPFSQMIMTLGKLLRPLRATSATQPQKAIALPLPSKEADRMDTMAFWLQLVSASLTGSAVEISLFSGMHLGKPRLIIAFNGVTPLMFQSLFDEQAANDSLLDLTRMPCNERLDPASPSCAALVSHLEHQELSALQLVASFRNAFG